MASSIYRSSLSLEKHGLLVAVDGLDGSGKTTLIEGIRDRLGARGSPAVITNWNDTTEIYNLMMRLNRAGELTNEIRCIFGAVELAARQQYVVTPALHRGETVLASKYLVSAFAHGLIRGHDIGFLNRIYSFAVDPDINLYVDTPPQTCLARKLKEGVIGFWEAGLDLTSGLPLENALEQFVEGKIKTGDIVASFLDFQSSLREWHGRLFSSRLVVVLDGALEPNELVDAAITEIDALTTGPHQPRGTAGPTDPRDELKQNENRGEGHERICVSRGTG